MRVLKFAAVLAVFGVLAGAVVMNWRWHQETQRQLDSLSAMLAERPVNIMGAAPAAPAVSQAIPGTPGAAPVELQATALPAYVVEPPDVLLCEAVINDPKTGESRRLPDNPISGQFLVRPDGSIGLGRWGSVVMVGMTCAEAAEAVRNKVTAAPAFRALELPAEALFVSVDVLAYNSKMLYVITKTGTNESIYSQPVRGNETVVKTITAMKGLPGIGSRRKIWVARPSTLPEEPCQILPVDWAAVTQRGDMRTNYQLLPRDRLYVAVGE